MNLPIQAPPVLRGRARIHASGQLQQSQAACDWQKCGGAVIGCITSCFPSPSLACITSCLGPLVSDCLPCVTHH
jgi:hypothetical protein